MKKITILFILHVCLTTSQGQGLSNFFSQKKADIQYMTQQVACLQMYIGFAEKGYQIAAQGLATIGQIKKGEFNLHSTFFQSLESVNPSIKKDAVIAGIITNQLAIIRSFRQIMRIKNMTPAELHYLQEVYQQMSQACIQSLTELIQIISDNTCAMGDSERLRRIDDLAGDMKNKYAFTLSFASDASLLSAQRQSEINQNLYIQSIE